MPLVKYALKFRISFYVLAVLILLAGVGAVVVMPKDVLPDVDIPVVAVVWTYTGLDTPEMEQRVTTYTRVRALQQRQRHPQHGEHDAAGRHHRADLLPARTSASTSRIVAGRRRRPTRSAP